MVMAFGLFTAVLLLLLHSEGSAQPANCVDQVAWADGNGYSCSDYQTYGWCQSGWYGPNWQQAWGVFSSYCASSKNCVGADAACCACGRNPSLDAVDCVVGDWGDWSNCTLVGDPDNATCQRSRLRAVVTLPRRGGASCGPLVQTQTCPNDACQPCAVGAWSDWQCYAPDTRLRTRAVATPSPATRCAALGQAQSGPGCTASPPLPAGNLLQPLGNNAYGQLGLEGVAFLNNLSILVPPPFGFPVTTVACGNLHTAVLAGGLLFVAGDNDNGQLGLGDLVQRTTFQMLPSPDLKAVLAVSLGSAHSAFLTARGAVYLFGANADGQLGQGNYTQSLLPAELRARGGRYFITAGVNVSGLALGGQMSALLTDTGAAYTFGLNALGQLGVNSSSTAIPYPSLVVGLGEEFIVSVAIGQSSAIFLTASGTAYSAGSNRNLQLGLSPTYGTVLVPIALPNVTVALAATFNKHTLFVLQDGTLMVAGDNTYGQLGLPPMDSVPLRPINISTSGTIQGIVAGITYSAVYDTAGNIYISGTDGNQADLSSCQWSSTGLCGTFSLVPNEEYAGNLVAVAAGAYHLAALKTRTTTPTPTQTGTVTSTASLTRTETQPPTPTPSFPFCGPKTLSLVDGPWTLATQSRCTQVLGLGAGSDPWQDRFLALRIQTLTGELDLSILQGCTAKCTLTYTTADVGAEKLVQLSSAPAASLSLLVNGGVRPASSRAGPPTVATVTFYLAHRGSALLLSLLAAAAALCAAGLVAGAWAGLWRWNHLSLRSSSEQWKRNPRTTSFWQKWLIAVAAWGVLTGVAWCAIVVGTSSPDPRPVALLAVGAALAGASGAVLLAYGLWALRDPEQHRCVSCDQPVSRWRFRGTYLPDPDNPMLCRKAHTAHIQCIACHTPVIRHAWLGATKLRPYHLACWEVHCGEMLDDPAAITRWALGHPPNGPPEPELAHVLAVAVRASAAQSIAELLRLSPSLVSAPVWDEGGRSALHLAARAGNLPVLELLLQANPYCLDPAFRVPLARRASVLLQQLGEDSDLYLHVPFLTLNCRPVYCGHNQGRYLFWYDPDTDGGKEKSTPGWCVATQLGSGLSPWRVPLPDGVAEEELETSASPKHVYHSLASLFHRTLAKTSHPKPDYTKTKSHGKRKQKPSSQSTEAYADPPTCRPAALHPEVRVDFLGHAVSLMEEAVSSGDEHTIRYVAQLYRSRHPQCLTWQYDTGHGLWDCYPADIQSAICTALLASQATVQVWLAQGSPATLDLRRGVHMAGLQTAAVRCRVGPLFQCRETQGQLWSEVTRQPPAPRPGLESYITLSPHHTLAAAPGVDTVALLWAEGMVDIALLAPPQRVRGAIAALSTSPALRQSDDLLEQEVSNALGLDGHALPAAPLPTTATTAARHRGAKPTAPDTNGEGEAGGAWAASTGIGHRLQDGLEGRQTCAALPLYGPGYCNHTGTLPFCAELPANPLGMRFELLPIVQMAADALMKLAELQRQGFPLAARHIIAAYVYSYELEGDVDQIYGEMNKAMRLQDMSKVEYWRPLIWDIDMALRALPSYEGKSYRGIKCQVSPTEFMVGGTICWTAFSSASQRKAVAEEFAKPPAEGRGAEVGTLFFVTSFGAKPISAISRYPEEAEVLFPPNTLFQVTSTLFGDSEIGEFYNVVDNVAMTQVAGGQPPPPATPAIPTPVRLPRLPQHHPFVLHVPAALADPLLLDNLLAAGGRLRLLSGPASLTADPDGPAGELQLVLGLPPLADPVIATAYGSYQLESRTSSFYQPSLPVPSRLQSCASTPTFRTMQWPQYTWKNSADPIREPSLSSSSSDSSFGSARPRHHHPRRRRLRRAEDPTQAGPHEKRRLLRKQSHLDSGSSFSLFNGDSVFLPPASPFFP